MMRAEDIQQASRTALKAAEPYSKLGHTALAHWYAARYSASVVSQALDLAREDAEATLGFPGPASEDERQQLLGLAVAWLQAVRSMSAATITAGKTWEEEQRRTQAPRLQSIPALVETPPEGKDLIYPVPSETAARSTQTVGMITTLQKLTLGQAEADAIADRVHRALRNAHPDDKGVSCAGGVEPMEGQRLPDGLLSFAETGRYGPDGKWKTRHSVQVFQTGTQAHQRWATFREDEEPEPWIEWFQLDGGGGLFLRTNGDLHLNEHAAAVTLVSHTARGRVGRTESQKGERWKAARAAGFVGPAPGDKLYPSEQENGQ